MAWIMLGIAGIFEVVWATFMKLSEGFTKIGWTALTFAGDGGQLHFACKGDENSAARHGVRHMDGHRRAWLGAGGYNLFQGASELLARFLRPDAAGRHSRTEADISIIFPWQCGSRMV